MMQPSLLISDLHLSSAPRDAYRFDVFAKVKEHVRHYNARYLWILGDLTDAKDNHAARLVNKVCDELVALTEHVEVRIVRGNHDGIDPAWPYFRFLNHMPRVHFYTEPTVTSDGVLVLPHVRDAADWGDLSHNDVRKDDVVMTHATFKGAESENGQEIGTMAVPKVLRDATIYAGDVHVPQTVGNVTYVGSPHHVHYGDQFKPRLLYVRDNGSSTAIELLGLRRLMIDYDASKQFHIIDCRKGDQAKVRVHLQESALGRWQEIRKNVLAGCAKLGLDVAAVELVRKDSERRMLRKHQLVKRSPQELVDEYVATHQLTKSTAERARELVQSLKQP